MPRFQDEGKAENTNLNVITILCGIHRHKIKWGHLSCEHKLWREEGWGLNPGALWYIESYNKRKHWNKWIKRLLWYRNEVKHLGRKWIENLGVSNLIKCCWSIKQSIVFFNMWATGELNKCSFSRVVEVRTHLRVVRRMGDENLGTQSIYNFFQETLINSCC